MEGEEAVAAVEGEEAGEDVDAAPMMPKPVRIMPKPWPASVQLQTARSQPKPWPACVKLQTARSENKKTMRTT